MDIKDFVFNPSELKEIVQAHLAKLYGRYEYSLRLDHGCIDSTDFFEGTDLQTGRLRLENEPTIYRNGTKANVSFFAAIEQYLESQGYVMEGTPACSFVVPEITLVKLRTNRHGFVGEVDGKVYVNVRGIRKKNKLVRLITGLM